LRRQEAVDVQEEIIVVARPIHRLPICCVYFLVCVGFDDFVFHVVKHFRLVVFVGDGGYDVHSSDFAVASFYPFVVLDACDGGGISFGGEVGVAELIEQRWRFGGYVERDWL
jgi:hypothetical protein